MRWQPQAAHFSEVGSVGVQLGKGINSPQPSKAWPPKLAAWFLRHSLYTNPADAAVSGGGWWCFFSAPLVKDKDLMGWVRGGVSLSVSGILVGVVVVVVRSISQIKKIENLRVRVSLSRKKICC